MTLTLDDTWQVARRDHRCDVCQGVIAAGDRYRRQRNVDGGDAWVWKAHGLCNAAHDFAWREFDLMYDDELHPDEAVPFVRQFFASLVEASR